MDSIVWWISWKTLLLCFRYCEHYITCSDENMGKVSLIRMIKIRSCHTFRRPWRHYVILTVSGVTWKCILFVWNVVCKPQSQEQTVQILRYPQTQRWSAELTHQWRRNFYGFKVFMITTTGKKFFDRFVGFDVCRSAKLN